MQGLCYYKKVKYYSSTIKGIMEIMEFALGLYVGLAAGFTLRGIIHKLDIRLKDYGANYGSKEKNRH